MLTAILYIRVSTDEQATKGYSQRSQAARLEQYCEANNIRVMRSIYEDASAKTFDRPQWQKAISEFKKHRENRPDFLLFTRWDRFSRNTADAYYMIKRLKDWGIESQATEQILDMSIPENKMLLAIYIVTAEVENDRRSLNVKHGLYRARHEGYWIGHAPLGYFYTTSGNGKKILERQEPEALLIERAFLMISENYVHISGIYRQIVRAGLKCSKSNFWKILKNPVYCGKIRVPGFDGQESCIVQGKHKGIITEDLFDEVQKVLKKRSRGTYAKTEASEFLPLRGLLHCPRCKRKLSGSGSLGYKLRYYYYHCQSACGYRVRADKTHEFIMHGLNHLMVNDLHAGLFAKIVREEYEKITRTNSANQAYITSTIEKLIERTIKAKTSLQNGYIDHEDFLAIQADCKRRINQLGQELHQAYSLEILKRNQLAENLSDSTLLGKLCQQIEDKNKFSLLNLIVKPSLILCTKEFNNNLSPIARFVFEKTNSLEVTDQSEPNTEQYEELNIGEFVDETVGIGKRRSNQITAIETEKRVIFIRKLAIFLVKNGFLHRNYG